MSRVGPLAVEQSLRDAFARAPQPHESQIAPHDCHECREIRKALAAHSFDSVPDETLDGLGSALPLLGGPALRYYLPTYLLRVLRDPSFLRIDSVIDYLATADTDERYLEFSEQERAAVKDFVEWFAGTPEAEMWSQELACAKVAWSTLG